EFLLALAKASHHNLAPLLTFTYSTLDIDPKTGKSLNKGTEYNYDAAYYAITCSEYGEGTAPNEDATAWQIMEQAKAFLPQAPRLLEMAYMDRLVGAFWPKPGPTHRPQAYAGGDFPTLIINANADPITPLSMAKSVRDHANNASLVEIPDGQHASWGTHN